MKVVGRVAAILLSPIPVVLLAQWTMFRLAGPDLFVPAEVERGWNWAYCLTVLRLQLVMGLPFGGMSVAVAHLLSRSAGERFVPWGEAR
jgi:hypothetical protein